MGCNSISPIRIAIDINDVLRDTTRQFADIYKKNINSTFDIAYEDINDKNFLNIFPFYDEDGNISSQKLEQFKYVDFPFELYARADGMTPNLSSEFTLWSQNTMRNFDDDKVPELILFSPYEMNLTIQSTLSFLSRFGVRTRVIMFPIDSLTMWDKCDVMITADPWLLDNKRDGKTSIKISAPYNCNSKADYSFGSLSELIKDEKNTIVDVVNKFYKKEDNE